MTDLTDAYEKLKAASSYLDIFPDIDAIPEIYRRMALATHPDRVEYGKATESNVAFKLLNLYKAQAMEMVAQNRFGQPVIMATITTKRARHEVKREVGRDEMAVFYRAVTVTESAGHDSMVKVARSAKDNDLFAQEARALKALNKDADKWTRAYPDLLDTFIHSEGRRRANVTPYFEGFHTLEAIRDTFPSGLDPIHGVWMFRRLLMAIGYANDQGIVHGAVVPSHVLIGPEDHAVVLIDWCYSQVIDDKSKTNFIKAVVPMYKSLYAPEVFAKETPSAATDIYMAATLMSYMMPVAPKPIRSFLKGTALTKQGMRPQNAWGLLKEFDELLESIGQPYHPRKFVEFVMPMVGATV
jgi:serine/threonine protein kinase